MKPLRILTLEPSRNGPVSKDAGAGMERLTYILDKELNVLGHETTMIAREGSEIEGKLIPIPDAWCRMTREDPNFESSVFAYLGLVLNQDFGKYDLVLDHMTEIMLFSRNIPIPVVTVLHMPPSYYWDPAIFGKLDQSNNPHVAICDTQKRWYEEKGIDIDSVIFNGIDIENFDFVKEKDDYLFFIGRIVEEKGVHTAIEIAKRTGKKLVIAGGPDSYMHSEEYFQSIMAAVDDQQVIYVGQVGMEKKLPLTQKACAIIMPSNTHNGFQESAPLVCLESLACGTPVIATNNGGLPELVEHRRTGYIGELMEDLVSAVQRISEIDPHECRRVAEEKYSGKVMAKSYENLFRRLVGQ